MLMQVVLVRLSFGAGIAWEFYIFYDFKSVVNIYVIRLSFYNG